METKQKLVTPEWAEEILTNHYKRIEKGLFRQRPMTPGRINQYANDMLANNWLLTPQPIAFDVNNDLIDGQTRLAAVVKAKKAVPMMVSTGWPASNGAPGVIDVIDSGRPRSISAMLHMHGTKNANNIASTLRFMCRVAHVGKSPMLTYSTTHQLLNKYGLQGHIESILTQTTASRDYQGRIIGPLAYYHSVRPNKARAFAASFFHFETTKGSPVQAFLTWLKNLPPGRRDSVYFLKAISSALRTWDAGETIQVIKPTTEAVEWLANQNPQLRAIIRQLVPRNA